MRTMTDGRRPGNLPGRIAMAAAAAMLLTACSGEKDAPARAAPEKAPAPVAVAAPAAPLPSTPARPEGADAIDTALAGVKAFNAKALADLAAIETSQKRIRDQAAQAMDAARRGDAGRVTAARNDAEVTHRRLADGLSAFRTTAAEQQAAVTAALVLCGPTVPALAPGAVAAPVTPPPPPVTTPLPGSPATAATATPPIYEGCTALTAEQALLTQNIEAVGARYQAAEAAYRQDKPRLEEAAATVALGKLGAL